MLTYSNRAFWVMMLCLSPLFSCSNGKTVADAGVDTDAGSSDRSEIDMLFVIDNSLLMYRKQAALAAGLKRMLETWDEVTGDNLKLDVHVAVVTTDLGNGGHEEQTGYCNEHNRMPGVDPSLGDDGILQTSGDDSAPECEDSYTHRT